MKNSHMFSRLNLTSLVVAALLGAGTATAQTTIVTAVRDGGNRLRLISWDQNGLRLNAEGASAGPISLISAARLGVSERMVTAVRDDGDNLLLIPWRVSFNGRITRLPQELGAVNIAGRVSRISAVANRTGDRVVTAVRDGSGNLRVISWSVSATSGSINRLHEGAGGAVNDKIGLLSLDHVISATFVGTSGTLLATAVRDGGGNLMINTWRLAPDGRVTSLQQVSAKAVTEVSAVGLGETLLVTAVRDGNGKLLLIAWNVAANGNISRRDEAQAGAATQITAFPLLGPRLATAVRDGGGNLLVISWEVSPTTNQIVRLDEEGAGAVSRIAASLSGNELTPPGTLSFQTTVRDGGGKLRIITWRSTPNGTGITRFPGGEATAGDVSLISTASFR